MCTSVNTDGSSLIMQSSRGTEPRTLAFTATRSRCLRKLERKASVTTATASTYVFLLILLYNSSYVSYNENTESQDSSEATAVVQSGPLHGSGASSLHRGHSLHREMSRNDSLHDLVPSWDGDLTKVDEYSVDVTAYVRGTRRDERYVCGPRLWRKLSGRAKQAAKDINWGELEKDKGAESLIRHIRGKLGAQPIQDAGKYLANWVFNLRRENNEPMPSYISRDDEAYLDVVRGFDTEYFKKQRLARLSSRATNSDSAPSR